jgi:hypothetical protein
MNWSYLEDFKNRNIHQQSTVKLSPISLRLHSMPKDEMYEKWKFMVTPIHNKVGISFRLRPQVMEFIMDLIDHENPLKGLC